ncbi:MAG: peptidylprolyl isomerase [Aphanocapsa sp. GSE-SYN-MK-11-07L]|nr:peptidylprolyl isomerase [Aphanocapsa sp. GSE-SYN-MK-11-07L]
MAKVFQVGDTEVDLESLPSLLGRYQLLTPLFKQLIIDQAIAKFDCSPDEKVSAVAAFYQQHRLETEAERLAWCKNQRIAPADLEVAAVRLLLINKFKVVTFAPKVESYFISRKQHLDRVIYSLIRTNDQNLAQELYFRILEAEDSFADIARQYSQGVEANTGGVIGPTALSKPHPVIAKVLSVSQPGQLWAPMPLENWTVILRLEQFMPAQLDDSMRSHLIDEMFEQWLHQQVQQVEMEPELVASVQ